jgi:hypothetical protein
MRHRGEVALEVLAASHLGLAPSEAVDTVARLYK